MVIFSKLLEKAKLAAKIFIIEFVDKLQYLLDKLQYLLDKLSIYLNLYSLQFHHIHF